MILLRAAHYTLAFVTHSVAFYAMCKPFTTPQGLAFLTACCLHIWWFDPDRI